MSRRRGTWGRRLPNRGDRRRGRDACTFVSRVRSACAIPQTLAPSLAFWAHSGRTEPLPQPRAGDEESFSRSAPSLPHAWHRSVPVAHETCAARGIPRTPARRPLRLRLPVRHPPGQDPAREVRGRPEVGIPGRPGPGPSADPWKRLDRAREPPEVRRGSPRRRAANRGENPGDPGNAVFRTPVRDRLLSFQDGPGSHALRHLVLHRWDATERIRAPGTALVRRVVVAGSQDGTRERVRTRP